MVSIENEKQFGNAPENAVFALDIGTRSIIGMVGTVEEEKIRVIAIEKEEHTKRSMVDGQIEDIDQVAKIARIVKERLEEKLECHLTRVCVAAAGRALKTERAAYEMELPRIQKIEEETISRLEAGAIGEAEANFNGNVETENKRQFFLVGYTVSQYYLDNYPISSLKDHHGKKIKAEVIATFLPSEVVESLYTTMHKIGLEIASLTLEPIAAINAAIPQNLRLLNLVLVDIGAGTSDIAVCRDGSVVGYTMATVAGDEITETLMKKYLVDFNTAEQIKFKMEENEEIQFTDILGMSQTISKEEILECIEEASQTLCREISERILEVNNGAPSAVFLAGGGSKLAGMRESIAKYLKMDANRVAIAGNNFQINAFSSDYDMNNPEYATPLGIVISAGLNLINDSCRVILNGSRAKLFSSGSLTVLDVLMMNGFGYQDLLGRSGQNLAVWVNGKRTVFFGGHAKPAVLQVNGEDGKVSDIVHAGDNILFEPAEHGEPAQMSLKELLDGNSEENVTVNGEKVPIDTMLKTGDVILIGEQLESDLEEDEDIAETEPIFIEERKEEQLYEEREQSHEEKKDSPLQEKEINISASEEILFEKQKAEEIPDMKEEQKKTEPIIQNQSQGKKLFLTLNDKPLILDKKEDGMPYYLMDMLQFSEIDFDNLNGEVVLKVNGTDGYFRQELRNNDVIQIYCE